MVVVPTIVRIKSKLKYWRITRMFLGYPQNHMGGTYLMLNLHMKHIVLIRNIIWRDKPMVSMYQDKNKPSLAVVSSNMKMIPTNSLA